MIGISIIMPAYNVEKYIQKAIDSIVNNGFERYELIIIDDNSTDSTLSVIKRNAICNSKIKVISTLGGNGCSYGRKIGLDVARGKYVYFCDADDFIEKGILNFLYCESEKYQLDVLMFNGRFKNELNNTWGIEHDDISIVSANIPTNVINGEQLLESMKYVNQWRYAVWLYFVRRQILEKNVEFFKGVVHEDPPYNYQLLNSSKRVKFYNVYGYNYRLRSDSLMSSKTALKDIEGYINAYTVICNYNDQNYKNIDSKKFYEIRMLEQLEESFSDLTCEYELKLSSKIIKLLLKRIESRNYGNDIVKRIKKEVQKYE